VCGETGVWDQQTQQSTLHCTCLKAQTGFQGKLLARTEAAFRVPPEYWIAAWLSGNMAKLSLIFVGGVTHVSLAVYLSANVIFRILRAPYRVPTMLLPINFLLSERPLEDVTPVAKVKIHP
jgi:hypothetical protein